MQIVEVLALSQIYQHPMTCVTLNLKQNPCLNKTPNWWFHYSYMNSMNSNIPLNQSGFLVHDNEVCYECNFFFVYSSLWARGFLDGHLLNSSNSVCKTSPTVFQSSCWAGMLQYHWFEQQLQFLFFSISFMGFVYM